MRGSIVDVYPSTDDHPVRIDLWGDEVDRLSAFSVADQRSTARRRPRSCIFPRRELLPTDEVRDARRRAGRARSRGAASSGSGWPTGQVFDGMESWLPWLTDQRAAAHRPAARHRARCCWSSRSACATAPQELLDEEAVAGGDARRHVGRGRRARPPPALAGLRPAARAHRRRCGVVAVDARPPRHAAPRRRARSTRWSATPTRSRAGCARSPARATASCSRPRATGSAQRLHDVLAGEGLDVAAGAPGAGRGAARRSRRSSAASCSPARSSRSWPRPTSPVAAACTAGPAARAAAQDFYDDLEPGDYVVHYQHGVGRYVGMKPLAHGRHRARLPAARVQGDDKVYVPTDQVGLVRKYTGGETPTLNRMGGADFEKHQGAGPQRGARDRRGARRAVPAAARHAGPRLRVPTRRGSTRSRRRSRSRRRPTSCRRSTT